MTPGSIAAAFLDDGTVSTSFMLSYRDNQLRALAAGRPWRELRYYTTTGGLIESRNNSVKDFLDQTDCEWLWLCDSDMGFEADALERLLEDADPVNAPVIGGLCFALKRNGLGEGRAQKFRTIPTVFVWREIEAANEAGFAAITDYPRDTVFQVGATGAAFLLCHRSALEKIRAEFGDNWFSPITHPTGKGGKPRVFSEDLSFCIRLAKADLPLFVDTGVRTSHEKGGVYLTEAVFDDERRLAALPAPPRISLLMPTRGRSEQVQQCINSAISTARGSVEVVCYVDDDDDQTAALLDEFKGQGVTYVRGPRIVLSQMWNRCAEKASADVMMHAGDDLIFRTPGWDARVLAEFEKVDDRIVFVHGNDLFQSHRLGTHGFLHRRWVEAVGHFVPPYFSSDFNDTWLTEVADTIGRRVYLPDVITEHMHPLAGKAEWDLTHRERLERHQQDDVGALYTSLAYERANDVAALRAVMS